jgi:integrase
MNTHLETLNSRNSRDRYAAIWRNYDGEMTAASIQRYVAERRDSGYAPNTVNLHLAALKHLARQTAPAQELAGIEAIKTIPVRGVRMGTWLSLDQVTALLSPSAKLSEARDRCLLALLCGCALRRSELAALTVAHVQTLDGRTVLLDITGKGQRVRTVPLPAWSVKALHDWLGAAGISSGTVLRGVRGKRLLDGGITADHIHAIVKKAGKRIGVPQLAPHDLRRTFARLALKGKADLTQIQVTLGHSSLAVTNRYLCTTVDLANPACDAIQLEKEPNAN